jgi:glycosyltransferase involved in cell wall biosynthesis
MIIENVSIARDHRARKQAASLLAAGYAVGVICRRDTANRLYRRPGLVIYEYPPPPERAGKLFFALEYAYSLLAAFALMIRALFDGRFHAIQTGQPPDVFFLSILPAKLLGARIVVDQRDLSPEVYANRFGTSDGIMPAVLRTLERVSWLSADHVVTVNESLVRVVRGRGRVAPERVTAVVNGPLLTAVDRSVRDDSLRRGFSRLVCWLGLMGPQDHAHLALLAISHYVHRLGRRDALFVFIGDGEEAGRLRRLTTELDVADFVSFTGWLEEEDVFSYLATADLGLDTNLQPEVTPVKALEYLAHSVPFVAFDLLETRALAGEAASYVEPADTEEMAREVARVLDGHDERAHMARIGRERIEREFAWDRQQDRYLGVYDGLLDGKAMVRS